MSLVSWTFCQHSLAVVNSSTIPVPGLAVLAWTMPVLIVAKLNHQLTRIHPGECDAHVGHESRCLPRLKSLLADSPIIVQRRDKSLVILRIWPEQEL
jgi:hypothetical protein